MTDLFLPNGEEIMLLTRAQSVEGAVVEVLTRGVPAIVHKQGSLGAAYQDATGHRFVSAFQDEEVDPTEAGTVLAELSFPFGCGAKRPGVRWCWRRWERLR